MSSTLAKLSWVYVVLGICASAFCVLLDGPARVVFFLILAAALTPGFAIAARGNLLPGRLLRALILTSIYGSIAAVICFLVSSDEHASVITATVLLITNLTILAATTYTARLRRAPFDRGDILDGLLIALAGATVAWLTVIQPNLSNSRSAPAAVVLHGLNLPILTPILLLTAGLALSSTRRSTASWLLVSTLILGVSTITLGVYSDVATSAEWARTLTASVAILTLCLATAAYVHPTSAEWRQAPARFPRLGLHGRIVVTGAALTIPMLLAVVLPTESTADRVVRATTALAILSLASLRFLETARADIKAQELLVEAALTDSLTGLPNRPAISDRTQHEINTLRGISGRPAVMVFDIDRFKNINDSLGHECGEMVLKEVARRLTAAATSIGAVVGRNSADEFLVLDVQAATPEQALANAEYLHNVFKQPISLANDVVFLTASGGVATNAGSGSVSAEDLLRMASIAMFKAKDAGRDCLALYHETMQHRLSERMELETALYGAIERQELRMFHQPIIQMDSGKVVGFESLMRWQRDDGTLLSPLDFIPIAEETGLISPIGSWAILESLTQLRTWIDCGLVDGGTTISVNVSPRQLTDPQFADIVTEALARSRISPHLLWLEVTENVMLAEPEVARRALEQLRAIGVRISIDDFGTGYSSLSLLQQFPIHQIKVDRSFVSGITDSENDESIVRTIVAMGQSLGLDVVAEGIETVQQLATLRRLGCSKGQGYLISHPVPALAMKSTISALGSFARWPEVQQMFVEEASAARSY